MKILLGVILSIVIVSSGITAYTQSDQIPLWIKDIVIFWANDKINDDEFINALEYLIESKIIKIDNKIDPIVEDPISSISYNFPFNLSQISGYTTIGDITLLGFEKGELVRDGLEEHFLKMDCVALRDDRNSCGFSYGYSAHKESQRNRDIAMLSIKILYGDGSSRVYASDSYCTGERVKGYLVNLELNTKLSCNAGKVMIDPDRAIKNVVLELNDNRKRPNEQRFDILVNFKIIE